VKRHQLIRKLKRVSIVSALLIAAGGCQTTAANENVLPPLNGELPALKGDMVAAFNTPQIQGDVKLCVFQGEGANTPPVFALHRLKSNWDIQFKEQACTEENLLGGVIKNATVQYVSNGEILTYSGQPFKHEVSKQETDEWIYFSVIESFDFGTPQEPLLYALTIGFVRIKSDEQPPTIDLSNGDYYLEATYDKGMPYLEENKTAYTLKDSVAMTTLCPGSGAKVREPVEKRQLIAQALSPVKGAIEFYYMAPRSAFEKTSPLGRWEKAVFEGLTSNPIELKGYFSQTYHPAHHNFSDRFIFEPRLDSDVPESVKQELKQQGIRAIYSETGLYHTEDQIVTWFLCENETLQQDMKNCKE
jgi:hypothetical protein